MSGYAVRCAACGERFEGPPVVVRDAIWPHHDTHDESEFPPAKGGGHVAFEGEDIVLSCNCGECDFCRPEPRPPEEKVR